MCVWLYTTFVYSLISANTINKIKTTQWICQKIVIQKHLFMGRQTQNQGLYSVKSCNLPSHMRRLARMIQGCRVVLCGIYKQSGIVITFYVVLKKLCGYFCSYNQCSILLNLYGKNHDYKPWNNSLDVPDTMSCTNQFVSCAWHRRNC